MEDENKLELEENSELNENTEQPEVTAQPDIIEVLPKDEQVRESEPSRISEPVQPYIQPAPTVVVNSAPKENQGMAIASMVVGIVSLLCSCCSGVIGIIGGIVGLALGIVCLVQKRPGKNFAIAGVVLNAIALLIGIAAVIIIGIFVVAGGAY